MPKGPTLDQLRAALEAQAALLLPALEQDRSAPSRCAGWTVGDLDRHLGAITIGLVRTLAAPAPARPDTDIAGWAAAQPALAPLIDEDARSGPWLVESLPAFLDALSTADPDRVVQQRTGAHRLTDAALFRVVELVAHGRDLPEPVQPDGGALKLAVRALAEVLAAKAPGRSVEVRIPPYAAVQCVEGPRHTRGNPPNVAECEPVAFVELCVGRLSWADAVADGRVRATGARADLSAQLPLLA
ncbi:MAG: sterol carrier family protein [Mycobacteriales bacterium]